MENEATTTTENQQTTGKGSGTYIPKQTLLAAEYAGAPITKEEVKLLTSTHDMLVTAIGNRPKTKSVWFKFEAIEDMYKQLAEERANGVGTDGLRVFFGTYPTNDLNGKPYDHPYQNTVIFVSTKSVAGMENYHENYFEHPEVYSTDPMNRGELCEPNCNGNDSGLI